MSLDFSLNSGPIHMDSRNRFFKQTLKAPSITHENWAPQKIRVKFLCSKWALTTVPKGQKHTNISEWYIWCPIYIFFLPQTFFIYDRHFFSFSLSSTSAHIFSCRSKFSETRNKLLSELAETCKIIHRSKYNTTYTPFNFFSSYFPFFQFFFSTCTLNSESTTVPMQLEHKSSIESQIIIHRKSDHDPDPDPDAAWWLIASKRNKLIPPIWSPPFAYEPQPSKNSPHKTGLPRGKTQACCPKRFAPVPAHQCAYL